MKKFILSLILLSTSTAFASDAAAAAMREVSIVLAKDAASDMARLKESLEVQKKMQEAKLREIEIIHAEFLHQTAVDKVKNASVGNTGHSPLQVPTVATNSVEAFIIAHPWYSVVGVAVLTFVVIKAWDHISKLNKDDEDSTFDN